VIKGFCNLRKIEKPYLPEVFAIFPKYFRLFVTIDEFKMIKAPTRYAFSCLISLRQYSMFSSVESACKSYKFRFVAD
jgi:hypothetical protein